MAPTLYCGIRFPTTTLLYDDPDHPDRVTSTIESASITPDDHALLEGLESYEATLCRCGFPREMAWHSDMDGWFEAEEYVCHACTAQAGRQVAYTVVRNTRPTDNSVPAFVLGVTTTRPD